MGFRNHLFIALAETYLAEDGHGVIRRFWHDDIARMESTMRLQAILLRIRKAVPEAIVAEDQSFRLTSIAFPTQGAFVARRCIPSHGRAFV